MSRFIFFSIVVVEVKITLIKMVNFEFQSSRLTRNLSIYNAKYQTPANKHLRFANASFNSARNERREHMAFRITKKQNTPSLRRRNGIYVRGNY
jgi:hypothetical protein